MKSTDSTYTPETTRYDQIRQMVESEFEIEEGFLEYDTPTFYVKLRPNSKHEFLKLFKKLEQIKLIPVLRRTRDKTVLKIVKKPAVKASKKIINIALFLATIATTLGTGYVLSMNWVEGIADLIINALMFTVAIMAILGAHEMAHKIAANKHSVAATYPYFIPGPPAPFGIGTFGAIIQQKSLPPNRDALFDLGMSGPILGFVVTIIVSAIGIQMSIVSIVTEPPPGSVQLPLLFSFLINILRPFSSISSGEMVSVDMHPIAVAGWIGMLITMLNLIPVGQLDGGHIIRVLLGDKIRAVIQFIAILALLLLGYWPFAIIALLLSRYRNPGPLDDVSKLSTSRKLVTIALILVFILSVAPLWTI